MMLDRTQRPFSHLSGLLYRIIFYYQKKIFPIFCFDGRDSEFKRLVTKDMLNGNNFGDLISLSSRRVSSFPARIKDVGVIYDLGIHDIDVMRYLVGTKVKNIYSLAGIHIPRITRN